ncbi:hypothetical protein ACW6QP_04285 [Salegentibacter sp. HM20]
MKKFSLLILLISLMSLACDRQASPTQTAGIRESSHSSVAESIEQEPLQSPSINDSVVTAVDKNETETVEPVSRSEFEKNPGWMPAKTSGYNWWMFGAIASLLLNFMLIFLLRKTVKSKEAYKDRKDHYKAENHSLNTRISQLISDNNTVIQQYQKLKTGKTSTNRLNYQKRQSPVYDNEKPVEVELEVINSSKAENEKINPHPINLYAEKATDNQIFSQVSDQQDQHKSIFKLTLDNENAETAKFEVIDSEFILKLVVNSPDTYLYPVCKPENNNQNFSGEILTTKPGIAHRVDGKWQVKDENKARIKFQ